MGRTGCLGARQAASRPSDGRLKDVAELSYIRPPPPLPLLRAAPELQLLLPPVNLGLRLTNSSRLAVVHTQRALA